MIEIVKAKPFLCVPAVLETILRHYGYTHLSQEEIARQFSLNADSSTDEKTWGIIMRKNTINDFFAKNCINLSEKYISIHLLYNEYDMLEKIKENLEMGFIVCGYNYSALYNNNSSSFCHVSIIKSIVNNKVYILDPGPKNYGGKYVQAEQLYYAIKRAQDGLWCITPTI